jgi:hypothetical protein
MIYRSYHPKGLSLYDVLMMTTAAPTYFDPHKCKSSKMDRKEILVGGDGGIFANHPGMMAYVEAKRKYPGSRIVMISLGTGKHDSHASLDYYNGRGLAFWAGAFPGISIDSTSSCVNILLRSLSKDKVNNFKYIRIQPILAKEIMITDGTSEEHIDKLVAAAMSSIGEGGPEQERFYRAVQILDSTRSMQ